MSANEELLKEVREEIKTLREQVRALDALIRLCHGPQAEDIRRNHERACRRMEEWRVSNLHRSRSPQ